MDLPARYVVGERKALATRLLNRSTAKGSIETNQSLPKVRWKRALEG